MTDDQLDVFLAVGIFAVIILIVCAKAILYIH